MQDRHIKLVNILPGLVLGDHDVQFGVIERPALVQLGDGVLGSVAETTVDTREKSDTSRAAQESSCREHCVINGCYREYGLQREDAAGWNDGIFELSTLNPFGMDSHLARGEESDFD